jgi:hypothetical protein
MRYTSDELIGLARRLDPDLTDRISPMLVAGLIA